MSYELLEQAAVDLGPLLDKVAFLGVRRSSSG